jgi:hypothetical protein
VATQSHEILVTFPQLAHFTDVGLLMPRFIVGLVFSTSGYSQMKDTEARSKSGAGKRDDADENSL